MNSLIEQLNMILEEVYVNQSDIELTAENHDFKLKVLKNNKSLVKFSYDKSFFESLINGLISNAMMNDRELINDIYTNLKYRLAIKVKDNKYEELLDAKYTDIEMWEFIQYIDVEHKIKDNNLTVSFKLIKL